MKDSITRLNIQTKGGNTLSFFYNPENNLLVVDLVHANERGGMELVRKTLNDEDQLLAHALPSVDIQVNVEPMVPIGFASTNPQTDKTKIRKK